MKYLWMVVTTALVVGLSGVPTQGQSLTSLLTPSERAAAGLSKLTPSELAALDSALLRIVTVLISPAMGGGRTTAGTADLDLFDAQGRPTAYLVPSDDLTFYLWSGEPVAYLDDDSVYGFNGKHLGWYHNGAVYDDEGDVVAAPARMFEGSVQATTARGLRGLRPLKGLKELKPLKPLFGLSWSATPAAVFFMQGMD